MSYSSFRRSAVKRAMLPPKICYLFCTFFVRKRVVLRVGQRKSVCRCAPLRRRRRICGAFGAQRSHSNGIEVSNCEWQRTDGVNNQFLVFNSSDFVHWCCVQVHLLPNTNACSCFCRHRNSRLTVGSKAKDRITDSEQNDKKGLAESTVLHLYIDTAHSDQTASKNDIILLSDVYRVRQKTPHLLFLNRLSCSVCQ